MDLVSIPANPVPEGAVTGTLKTKDGVSLRFTRWHPPPGRKGTVVIFQGRAEFIEKYFETVRELRSRGFAVAIIDWRGQGMSERALSDPRKGHVGDFSEYELDMDVFIKTKSGVSQEAARAALQKAVDKYGQGKVLSKREFIDSRAARLLAPRSRSKYRRWANSAAICLVWS